LLRDIESFTGVLARLIKSFHLTNLFSIYDSRFNIRYVNAGV
jgi:hypothetical protein